VQSSVFVGWSSCLLVACSGAPPDEAAGGAATVAASTGHGSGGAASTSASTVARGSSSPASGSSDASTSSATGAGGAGFDCLAATGLGGAGEGGAGGAGGACDPPHFATRIVSACIGPDGGFGEDDYPGDVLGPPKGAGDASGSFDVLGLGEGGSIVLAFDGGGIVDGPGADFIVFENPFFVGGDPQDVYANPGTVAVSEDGEAWTSFPCTATAYPWGSCAGWHPVYANASDNSIDPLDPATAGGDAFDLADIGVAHARFVRITDRPDLPGDFDLDAVAVVNAGCP
jgi:hypothetical protein